MATDRNTRFQLTTDGLQAYIRAVDEFLLDRCDYAQLVKTYSQPQENERAIPQLTVREPSSPD